MTTKVKQDTFTLNATKRTELGKKVKKLRTEGKIPANIYGEGFTSQAVTVEGPLFQKLFKKAGETQIVYVTVEGAKEALPVLIHNVQYHPLSHQMLHADLRKVDLTKKIETEVPVQIIGESEAVISKNGVLQTLSDTVLVEALPDHIPHEIVIDISILKEINDEIKIKDLKVSGDYVFKDDIEKSIVRITEHKEEEVTPQTEAPETEITEQKAEGEEATEGEEAKTETKEETPSEPKAPNPESTKE